MAKKGKTASLGTIGFMFAAVVFAAVAGTLLSGLMGNTYSKDPVLPVLVAANPISAGQPFNKNDLRVAQWPRSSIPEGAFSTPEQLLASSRVPLISFAQGEVILSRHLSPAKAGIGIAPLIEPDHRAMSIRTDDPVSLARLLYPGARVDLISTMKAQGGGVLTKTVIQNAKVLAVGEEIDPLTMSQARRKPQASAGLGGTGSEEGDTAQERKEAARGVVTLSVTPEQAERLSLASREGKIDVVLRSPSDSRTVETPGATPGGLAKESGAPPPENEMQLTPLVAERKKRPARPRPVARAGSGKKSSGSAGPVIIKGGS